MARTVMGAVLLVFMVSIAFAQGGTDTVRIHPSGVISGLLRDPSNATIDIVVRDNAMNGCWTNLGEVRTYTADSVATTGFVASPNSALRIYVDVLAERNRVGGCFGVVNIDLVILASNGWIRQLAGWRVIFTGENNANFIVLDAVARVTRAIAEDAR